MMTFARTASTAALTLGLAVSACGPSVRAPAAPAPQPGAATTAAELEADSVRRSFTTADVEFMTGMIGHHTQAIVISRWAPTHEASPALLRLTERVINAQQDEIASMQRWLRDRRQPVPDPESHEMMMMAQGHEHMALMPGMLTAAQMQQLGQARGPEFDRLFLTFMIQHHQGALTMVERLFGTRGAGQEDLIFKLASDVHTDQATEIARMERMLAGMPPAAPRAP